MEALATIRAAIAKYRSAENSLIIAVSSGFFERLLGAVTVALTIGQCLIGGLGYCTPNDNGTW
jgi:hypothetical protein